MAPSSLSYRDLEAYLPLEARHASPKGGGGSHGSSGGKSSSGGGSSKGSSGSSGSGSSGSSGGSSGSKGAGSSSGSGSGSSSGSSGSKSTGSSSSPSKTFVVVTSHTQGPAGLPVWAWALIGVGGLILLLFVSALIVHCCLGA